MDLESAQTSKMEKKKDMTIEAKVNVLSGSAGMNAFDKKDLIYQWRGAIESCAERWSKRLMGSRIDIILPNGEEPESLIPHRFQHYTFRYEDPLPPNVRASL